MMDDERIRAIRVLVERHDFHAAREGVLEALDVLVAVQTIGRALLERNAKVEIAAAGAQAETAAMRAALEKLCTWPSKPDFAPFVPEWKETVAQVRAALNDTAGRALLAELEALRAELTAVKAQLDEKGGQG